MRSRTDGFVEVARRKDDGNSLATFMGESLSTRRTLLSSNKQPVGSAQMTPTREGSALALARARKEPPFPPTTISAADYSRSTSKETPIWPKPTIDITSEERCLHMAGLPRPRLGLAVEEAHGHGVFQPDAVLLNKDAQYDGVREEKNQELPRPNRSFALRSGRKTPSPGQVLGSTPLPNRHGWQ